VINAGFGLFWLPNDVTLAQNPGWDGTGSYSTNEITSTNGWTPTSNITQPYPLVNGVPGIVQPPGNNVKLYQQIELGNGPTEQLPNTPWAYTEQWNFGVQQQLGKTTAIDISYAGAAGTHLPAGGGWLSVDPLPDSYLVSDGINGVAGVNALSDKLDNPFVNAVVSSASLSTPTVTRGHMLTPFPQYAGMSSPDNVSSSDYHALEVKLQKRFAQGASVNVAYTFSKFQSNTDTLNTWLESVTGVGDVNNMKKEKSLSSSDAPQRLVIAYVYDLPVGRGKQFLPNINRAADLVVGGWGLQGLTTLMKGFPLGIGEGTDNINTVNNGGSRPDVVAGCSKKISGSAVSKLNGWFNSKCFQTAPAYVYGDESRLDSTLEAPGVANWDMSIVKKFAVTADGRVNVQFRAEFFNLFNRVQFGYPNTTFDASNAGTISSQYNLPRLAQFALRIAF